ncbi:unnamed protein product [Pylaiella littoralis]
MNSVSMKVATALAFLGSRLASCQEACGPSSSTSFDYEITPVAGLDVRWSLDTTAETISFEVVSSTQAWLGLGFPADALDMTGADAVIGLPVDNSALEYDLAGKAGVDDVTEFPDQEITGASVSQVDGITTLTFTRPLSGSGTKQTLSSTPGDVTGIIYAVGSSNELAYHGQTRGGFEVDLFCGDTAAASGAGDTPAPSTAGGAPGTPAPTAGAGAAGTPTPSAAAASPASPSPEMMTPTQTPAGAGGGEAMSVAPSAAPSAGAAEAGASAAPSAAPTSVVEAAAETTMMPGSATMMPGSATMMPGATTTDGTPAPSVSDGDRDIGSDVVDEGTGAPTAAGDGSGQGETDAASVVVVGGVWGRWAAAVVAGVATALAALAL